MRAIVCVSVSPSFVNVFPRDRPVADVVEGIRMFGKLFGCSVGARWGGLSPAQASFVKPGEKKTVTLGIRRGKRFEEDVALTFTDVPKGVTFEPAKPVSKHPSAEVEFTIQAAKDAALGDFAIKVTGGTANGHARENQLELSVDATGEAARSGSDTRATIQPISPCGVDRSSAYFQ